MTQLYSIRPVHGQGGEARTSATTGPALGGRRTTQGQRGKPLGADTEGAGEAGGGKPPAQRARTLPYGRPVRRPFQERPAIGSARTCWFEENRSL